jgi:hypothetical protein
MRKILLSDEVWEAIATRGKFGETEEDVLRRILHLPAAPATPTRAGAPPGRGAKRYAQKAMSAKVVDGVLRIRFADGERNEWRLPARTDKAAIRKIRDEAVEFALQNGATNPGQTNAVRKAFSDAGYHLTK